MLSAFVLFRQLALFPVRFHEVDILSSILVDPPAGLACEGMGREPLFVHQLCTRSRIVPCGIKADGGESLRRLGPGEDR